jgi:hypothetical protein
MMFLALASALLVTVYGQAADPTKICLPDVLQVHSVSLTTNVSGVIAFDYPNKAISIRDDNGIRSVYNLNDFTLARINEADSSCVRITPPGSIRDLVSQCLPAGARQLTQGNIYLGLSPARLDIQGWEFAVESIGTVSVGITTGSPSVPVIRHFISSSQAPSDIQILVNAKTSIDDATIFAVPDDCPAHTVVG